MNRTTLILFILVMPLSVITAQSGSSGQAGFHATFKSPEGIEIKLDTRTGVLDAPRSLGTGLQDCSNKVQVCLTDHHGFAFAYPRKCDDSDYKSLTFPPKVAFVLDNNDVWLLFDAAPNYLFHYAYSKGIIGIYFGPTASFDFRSLFQDRSFKLLSLAEFRISGSDTVAACSP